MTTVPQRHRRTDRQTDGRPTIAIARHRAVQISQLTPKIEDVVQLQIYTPGDCYGVRRPICERTTIMYVNTTYRQRYDCVTRTVFV